MSFAAIQWAWRVPNITPAQRLVLLALGEFANEGGVSGATIATLATRCHVCERTVRRGLDELETAGALSFIGIDGALALYQLGMDNLSTPPATGQSVHPPSNDNCDVFQLVAENSKRNVAALDNLSAEWVPPLNSPPPPSLHPSPSPPIIPPSHANGARAKATRLSADWQPSPRLVTYLGGELGMGRADIDRFVADFRDYWTAKAGSAGVKLDWEATARIWARRMMDNPPGQHRQSSGPKVRSMASEAAEFLAWVDEHNERERARGSQ